ncbi:MAG: hypothetical protein JWM47_3182 [Acidimicrobiales bacterium]|nr:hypothetical protein [Acidimicrobiales bacterium]
MRSSPTEPTGRHRGARRAIAALALALATAVASCSCNRPPPPEPGGRITPAAAATTSPPTPATTTALPHTPEQKVTDAYRYADAVYSDAVLDPWTPDPRLVETMVDPILTSARKALKEQADKGVVSRYPGGNRPTVAVRAVEVTGPRAGLDVCLVDASLQVRQSDGTVTNDDITSNLLHAAMVLTDGRWKLQDETYVKTWPDAEGCDR